MAGINEVKAAREVYARLVEAVLSECGEAERKDAALLVRSRLPGEDAVTFAAAVRPRYETVSLFAPLPIRVPASRKEEVFAAVIRLNHGLAEGLFDCDPDKGTVGFRMTQSYSGAALSADTFRRFLKTSAEAVAEGLSTFAFLKDI